LIILSKNEIKKKGGEGTRDPAQRVRNPLGADKHIELDIVASDRSRWYIMTVFRYNEYPIPRALRASAIRDKSKIDFFSPTSALVIRHAPRSRQDAARAAVEGRYLVTRISRALYFMRSVGSRSMR